jgi:response regulator RpfG family c-di-GMP phosphodiesterase
MIEGSKILLVDDSPEIIEILGDFFALNGCHVHKAYTGNQALETLSKKDIEVVILDVNLPDVNGIALLDTIKVNTPAIAVIMATGFYDPNFIVDAMKKGASDFLIKPFELDKLMLIMMRVLRERTLVMEKENILSSLEDKKKIEMLNRELQRKIKELTTMYHISNKFNSLSIFDDVYEKMIAMVKEILDVRSCGYYIVDSDNRELILYKGFSGDGDVVDEQKILMTEDFFNDAQALKKHVVKDNKIFLPLIIKNECIGFIMADCKNGNANGHLMESNVFFLKLVADKASTQIENKMLYESLFESIIHTLKSLIVAINKRDLYTEGHCKRVTEMSMVLAERIGLADYERDVIRVVGPIHDLGKIGIPDAILLKPGKLTDEEYALMKGHSMYGEQIMNRFEILANEARIIRHHHERYDGRGYPDALCGKEIPVCSRVLAVCDTYDAMATNRPYRNALVVREILNEIERCKGSQFDPDIADSFIGMLKDGGYDKR